MEIRDLVPERDCQPQRADPDNGEDDAPVDDCEETSERDPDNLSDGQSGGCISHDAQNMLLIRADEGGDHCPHLRCGDGRRAASDETEDEHRPESWGDCAGGCCQCENHHPKRKNDPAVTSVRDRPGHQTGERVSDRIDADQPATLRR